MLPDLPNASEIERTNKLSDGRVVVVVVVVVAVVVVVVAVAVAVVVVVVVVLVVVVVVVVGCQLPRQKSYKHKSWVDIWRDPLPWRKIACCNSVSWEYLPIYLS